VKSLLIAGFTFSLISITVKVLYWLGPMFVVSAKYIDPWVLEFVLSNYTGNNQWGKCVSLDFNFWALIEVRNPRKCEPRD
jgi:hypothetical protein